LPYNVERTIEAIDDHAYDHHQGPSNTKTGPT
jgi:hypothetical protein